jgi:hypothetical protein
VWVETELAREKTDDTDVEAVDAIDVVDSFLASATMGESNCSALPGFDFFHGHLKEVCREGAALVIGSADGSSESSGKEVSDVVRSGTALRAEFCDLCARGLLLYGAKGTVKSVVKLEKSTLIRELGRLSDKGINESVSVILTIIVT